MSCRIAVLGFFSILTSLFNQVLAKLTTNFIKVHSRLCIDEAELAEHIVGLTCNLSSCQFRYFTWHHSVFYLFILLSTASLRNQN